jgi:hypothetical protein
MPSTADIAVTIKATDRAAAVLRRVSRETRGRYRLHQSHGLHNEKKGGPAWIRWSDFGPMTRIEFERSLIREHLETKGG